MMPKIIGRPAKKWQEIIEYGVKAFRLILSKSTPPQILHLISTINEADFMLEMTRLAVMNLPPQEAAKRSAGNASREP